MASEHELSTCTARQWHPHEKTICEGSKGLTTSYVHGRERSLGCEIRIGTVNFRRQIPELGEAMKIVLPNMSVPGVPGTA